MFCTVETEMTESPPPFACSAIHNCAIEKSVTQWSNHSTKRQKHERRWFSPMFFPKNWPTTIKETNFIRLSFRSRWGSALILLLMLLFLSLYLLVWYLYKKANYFRTVHTPISWYPHVYLYFKCNPPGPFLFPENPRESICIELISLPFQPMRFVRWLWFFWLLAITQLRKRLKMRFFSRKKLSSRAHLFERKGIHRKMFSSSVHNGVLFLRIFLYYLENKKREENGKLLLYCVNEFFKSWRIAIFIKLCDCKIYTYA